MPNNTPWNEVVHHTIVDAIPIAGCACSTCAQVTDMLASSPIPIVCERRARSEDNWCSHKEAGVLCTTGYEQPEHIENCQCVTCIDDDTWLDTLYPPR